MPEEMRIETSNENINVEGSTTDATTGIMSAPGTTHIATPPPTPAPRIADPIYSGVKAKSEVVKIIKQMVKCGYFRKPNNEKEIDLSIVKREVCRMYNIPEPQMEIGRERESECPNRYEFAAGTNGFIHLKNYSIVSFLHEFRHHLQRTVPGAKYKNMSIEEDARAWSLRVYSSACPRMFEEAVRRGRIYFLRWDGMNNRIANDIEYPDTLAEAEGQDMSNLSSPEFVNNMFQTAPVRTITPSGLTSDVMNAVVAEFRHDSEMDDTVEEYEVDPRPNY